VPPWELSSLLGQHNRSGVCSGFLAVQEFVIKIQAPSAGDRIATFCKATVDLSKYVTYTPEPSTQADVIPLTFKVGGVAALTMGKQRKVAQAPSPLPWKIGKGPHARLGLHHCWYSSMMGRLHN